MLWTVRIQERGKRAREIRRRPVTTLSIFLWYAEAKPKDVERVMLYTFHGRLILFWDCNAGLQPALER